MASDFNEQSVGRSSVSQRLDFGILRGKVICDYCDKTMAFQRTKIKKGKNAGSWMISYYCRNKALSGVIDIPAVFSKSAAFSKTSGSSFSKSSCTNLMHFKSDVQSFVIFSTSNL